MMFNTLEGNIIFFILLFLIIIKLDYLYHHLSLQLMFFITQVIRKMKLENDRREISNEILKLQLPDDNL